MKPVITKYCAIKEDRIHVNDRIDTVPREVMTYADYLTTLYRHYEFEYPKFFRMDNLCKLAFVTAELLLRDRDIKRRYDSDIALVLSNGASSIDTDLRYASTFSDKAAYFPSPALFVYTLPNVMIGELCIRHKVMGENALFISEEFDPYSLCDYIDMAFRLESMESCITGWVDLSADRCESILFLVEPEHNAVGSLNMQFDGAHLYSLYQKS
jgi:hypothetical protein